MMGFAFKMMSLPATSSNHTLRQRHKVRLIYMLAIDRSVLWSNQTLRQRHKPGAAARVQGENRAAERNSRRCSVCPATVRKWIIHEGNDVWRRRCDFRLTFSFFIGFSLVFHWFATKNRVISAIALRLLYPDSTQPVRFSILLIFFQWFSDGLPIVFQRFFLKVFRLNWVIAGRVYGAGAAEVHHYPEHIAELQVRRISIQMPSFFWTFDWKCREKWWFSIEKWPITLQFEVRRHPRTESTNRRDFPSMFLSTLSIFHWFLDWFWSNLADPSLHRVRLLPYIGDKGRWSPAQRVLWLLPQISCTCSAVCFCIYMPAIDRPLEWLQVPPASRQSGYGRCSPRRTC